MLTLYVDGGSQPCRAVWLLLETTGTPYETHMVDLTKGENRSENFITKFPSGTLPAIKDNELCLFESSAIMKYLVSQYQLPDHWYPSDIKRRAKIDEYLSWHTGNLRQGAGMYLFYKYISVKFLGIPAEESSIRETQKAFPKSIDLMESYYLKETQFISSNEISIADIQALCELTQFWMISADDPLKKYLDRPRIAKWMDDCIKLLNPHFDKVHDAAVYKVRNLGLL